MPKNMSGYLVAAIMRMIMMPVLAVCFVHLDAQVSTVGFRGEKIMTAKKILQIPMALRQASFALLDENSE